MPEIQDHTIDMLAKGQSCCLVWDVTETEIDEFAALSGDFNPLHIDDAYATQHGFVDRVAHGFLLGAKLSGLIGMTLPGRRCLLLEQSLSYPNPVHPGDRVEIVATVQDVHQELSLITLKIKATTLRGDIRTTVGRGNVTCRIL